MPNSTQVGPTDFFLVPNTSTSNHVTSFNIFVARVYWSTIVATIFWSPYYICLWLDQPTIGFSVQVALEGFRARE